jgi:mannose-6-phosphate isomerase-like protein (cupin superfamily)
MAGYIVLRKHVVKRDWKLAVPGNNGRKVLVNRIREHRERPIEDPEWAPEPDGAGRTPVLETGAGGLEVATCTERAAQDRHMHRESTEIYTVLEGRLAIYLNDEGPLELGEGDEAVILPETVHQVAPLGPVLVRVHAVDSGGESDKYVQLEQGGEWLRWSELGPDARAGAYRMVHSAG